MMYTFCTLLFRWSFKLTKNVTEYDSRFAGPLVDAKHANADWPGLVADSDVHVAIVRSHELTHLSEMSCVIETITDFLI